MKLNFIWSKGYCYCGGGEGCGGPKRRQCICYSSKAGCTLLYCEYAYIKYIPNNKHHAIMYVCSLICLD